MGLSTVVLIVNDQHLTLITSVSECLQFGKNRHLLKLFTLFFFSFFEMMTPVRSVYHMNESKILHSTIRTSRLEKFASLFVFVSCMRFFLNFLICRKEKLTDDYFSCRLFCIPSYM